MLSIQESIVNHVEYTLARTRHQFDDFECYQAAAYSLRDRLIEMWNDTQTYYKCVSDSQAAHTQQARAVTHPAASQPCSWQLRLGGTCGAVHWQGVNGSLRPAGYGC